MKKQIITKDPSGHDFIIDISTDGIGCDQYFSITATGFRRFGCLHDEILQYRPDLKPLIDIHLSNLDGMPMHAEANGWYWLAKACGIKQQYEPDQSELDSFVIFGQHIRTLPKEAHEILKRVKTSENPRLTWQAEVQNLLLHWKTQAENALKLIQSLP